MLLAFCTAQALALVPLTPGGLGFVEAGLTGTLVLAGVASGDAVVATLAYRLAAYWVPLPLGAVAYVVHRRVTASPRSPTRRPRRDAQPRAKSRSSAAAISAIPRSRSRS